MSRESARTSVFSICNSQNETATERSSLQAQQLFVSRNSIMKTILVISLALAASLHAQYVVTNPVSDALGEIQHVEDIAKAVEMISNQVQQLNTLNQQLQQIQAYVNAFGNPEELTSIIGADGLIQSLQSTGSGQSLLQLRGLTDGGQALSYNGQGVFQNIGSTFSTPSGDTHQRDEEAYRKFSAIEQTSNNYQAVYDEVAQRRTQLRQQIAQTTSQLQASTTDAETQKLTGVIAGYNAELSSVEREIEQALGNVVVQDTENRADTEKQEQARREERKAEFSEALKKYSETFQLDSTPAQFPEE